MRPIFTLLVMVALFGGVFAQSSAGIKGTVYDYSGAVVLGVEFFRIAEKKNSLLGSTNDNGEFRIELEKGKHTVEIRHKAGLFCPFRLVHYDVVEMMRFDLVVTILESSQDSGKCKIKKIKF